MPRYRHVDVDRLPAGDRVVVVRRDDARRHALRPLDARLLGDCDRFAPLEAHAARLAPAVERSPAEVRRRLERLVRRDLLHRPSDRIGGTELPDRPATVDTVALVTRDRPETLARAVASVLAAGVPRVRIYDDSADPAVQRATRRRLADLAAQHGGDVAWAGPEDKRRYGEELAREAGVDPALTSFALVGPEGIAWRPGANRNALLLGSTDRPVLSLDDDVVFRFAPVPDREGGIRVVSGGAPQGHHFFADPAAALTESRFAPFDALGAVSDLLGRPVGRVLAGADPEAGWWDDLSVARATRLPRSRVGFVVFGGVGDSGMASPHFALHLRGPARERAWCRWGTVRRSRGLLRGARQATVTDAPHLMSMAFALDTRTLVPPFSPVGRNADGLLGRALRVLQPDRLLAHLPRAIHHAPPDPRRYPAEAVWRGPLRLELVEVLMWACELEPPGTALEVEERFAAVGRTVRGLGAAPRSALQELLRTRWRQRAATLATALAHRLAAHPEAPEPVRADLQRARDAQLEAAGAPPIPWELRELPRDQALDRTRAVLRAWGALVAAWPALVAAARALPPPARRVA